MIATYGGREWADLAYQRAVPSAEANDPYSVCVVHEPEGTIASARNLGAQDASGDWLCFLDADDELDPLYIRAMQQANRIKPGDRNLYTPKVSYVRRGRRERPRFWPTVPLESGNWMVIGTVVHRSLFDEVGGFREWPHGLEDWDLWSRIWRAGCQIVKVQRAVYVAHWNDNSKHHQLMRDRARHLAAYNEVARSHQEERA